MASGFNFEGTMKTIFEKGFVSVLSSAYNVGILIFLVILGMVVALMNKTGGSDAFGKWASKRIKTRVGAQLTSILLGCLIFIDDYFNCLTVGSVMRPVTDKHQVSRAKLAYLIDATAAPVCIISPISSWAANNYNESKNATTLQGTWQRNATGWWYAFSDGTYVTSSWKQIGGEWYYFNADGYMLVGWQNIGGNWYYMDLNRGNMLSNTTTPDGYFVNESGAYVAR